MTERGPYPPHWVAEAEQPGVDPVALLGSAARDVELILWRALGPVTGFELAWAMARLPGPELPVGHDAIARVVALREARAARSDLSDNTWQQLITDIGPQLSLQARTEPRAILAVIERRIEATAEILRPVLAEERRTHTRAATAARVGTANELAARAAALRAENTVAQVALKMTVECGRPISVRNVYRYLARHRKNS